MKEIRKGRDARVEVFSDDFTHLHVMDAASRGEEQVSLRGGGSDRKRSKEHVESIEKGPFAVQRYLTTIFEFTGLATDKDKQVEVVGNAELFSRFHHVQGANTVGDNNTCLLAACEHVIR